ncbi:MAG: SMP-30/gluconolactonase/LRE family protein [Paracoccaceae bacterium]
MTVSVYDDTQCELGEGPLWHPERKQLFWFDINGMKLHTREGDKLITRDFDEHYTAAGWVDHDTLMLASESGLYRYDIASGDQSLIVEIEADNPDTRSNDGRADPFGGFWIGTMGKTAQDGVATIYRYYRGELRALVENQTITNSICFSPDRKFAYYACTRIAKIMRQALDAENGWPVGEAEVFIDLSNDGINPDGSVVDAAGNLWNAQWGAGRVVQYDATGKFIQEINFPAAQTTCPAFGGDDLTDLFMTSAGRGMEGLDQGKTFIVKGAGKGQPEPAVIL